MPILLKINGLYGIVQYGFNPLGFPNRNAIAHTALHTVPFIFNPFGIFNHKPPSHHNR